MSDHKELCALLRELCDDLGIDAADVIERQAARIAELERGCRCAECREPALHQPVCEPCVRLVLERRQERIAELEAAARWRPMSEKPVDESNPVIAIDGDEIIFPAYWSGGKLYAVDRHDRIRFVAWLPIPAFEEPKP